MKSHNSSLLSKQAMGGIIGEGGYVFQDVYIVCKIPELIRDTSFVRILKEGAGDVDIEYQKNDKSIRVYTQLKDHTVGQSEFRDVFKQFKEKDATSSHTYNRFVLGSTGLHPDVTRLSEALKRLRGAKDFYGPKEKVTNDTVNDFDDILKKLKILDDSDFIRSKVYFEDNLGALTASDQTIRLFCGGMCQIPAYETKLAAFRHVFHPLHTFVTGCSGRTINRSELESKIDELIEENRTEIREKGFTVRMYHWEDEPYELNLLHDEIIDWSKYFDRKTRKIPTPDIWRNELLPQLTELQQKIRKNGLTKLINFEGSACLSSGIALGWTFPEVATYVIQIQPRFGQRTTPWRIDAKVEKTYKLQSSNNILSPKGTGLAVRFNMAADTSGEFEKYLAESEKRFHAVLDIYPENGIGEAINEESCITYSRDAKRIIRDAASKYGIDRIDVFFAGPLSLAVFFGQLLNAMPSVQCYEQKIGGGYLESCYLPHQ